MTAPIEDRVRQALEVQAQGVPVDRPRPWRANGRQTHRRRRPTWSRPMLAVGASLALVVVTLIVRSSERTEPRTTVVAGQPAAPADTPGLQSTPLVVEHLPAAPGPRPVLADVEMLAASPIERASMAFQASRSRGDTRSSWFVSDPRAQTLRAVVDLPVSGAGDLSPDGRALVFVNPLADDRSAIAVIDIPTGRTTAYARTSAVKSVKWSPSGSQLAMLERTNTDLLWRVTVLERDGSLVASGGVAEGEQGSSLAWSPDGSHVAMLGCQGLGACRGTVLNVARNEFLRTSQPVIWMAWADAGHVVGERPFGGALVTDTAGVTQREITVDGRPAGPQAVSPDGKSILMLPSSSGVGQTFVRVVDIQTGATARELVAPQDGVPSVLGWSGSDVLVLRERPGRQEVVRVRSTLAAGEVILSRPFSGEGFSSTLVVAGWFAAG